MIPDLLPIGSIVLLKGEVKKSMITGFCAMDEDNEIYDYCGCDYPDGMKNKEGLFIFNHDQIEKVYFIGKKEKDNKEESIIDAIKEIYKDV